jgi:hypothetical protein
MLQVFLLPFLNYAFTPFFHLLVFGTLLHYHFPLDMLVHRHCLVFVLLRPG